MVRTARTLGALAVPRVTALRGVEEGGRIVGCTVRDELSGSELDIRAASTIDATGVWAGRADGPFPSAGDRLTKPSRGTHIIVPRERIPSRYGLTLRIPHRVCFLVPWPDGWLIGTTDHEDHGAPDRPTASLAEVDEILANVNGTLSVGLTRSDVVSAFAGIRPLATDPGGSPGSTVKASREHRIRTERNGLVRIGGGKFTTYRLMAAQTVDAAIGRVAAEARPSRTAETPIAGAASIAELEALAAAVTRNSGLDPGRAERVVARFGAEAGEVIDLGRELDLLRPLGPSIAHLEAEVAWSVRKENALSVDDFLSRRTRLSRELPDRGAAVAPRVAELMGAELGWSATERDQAVTAFLSSAHHEYDVPSEA